MEQRKDRRLILFPLPLQPLLLCGNSFTLPLQGHINPMLELANVLHSKGFSITITSCTPTSTLSTLQAIHTSPSTQFPMAYPKAKPPQRTLSS
ncbi:hypothetical protein CerSpe_090400 [Prunus speciosa]